MDEPVGFQRRLDPSAVPAWKKIRRGLLLITIAWPLAHAGLAALVVMTIPGLTFPVLLATALTIELGGILCLIALYLCTASPRRATIPPLALAALLALLPAIALSIAEFAIWISFPRLRLPQEEELEGIAFLLGVGAFGCFALSHLLCVAFVSAVRRYARPLSSHWTAIAYAIAFAICALVLGLVLAMPMLPWTMQRIVGIPGRFQAGGRIPTVLEETMAIAIVVVAACFILLNGWFALLVIRARQALTKLLQSATATSPTGS